VDFFQAKVSQDRVRVGEDLIIPTTSVCNLGVHLDSFFMRTHVLKTVSSCFAILRHVTSLTDCSPCLTPLHGSSSRPRNTTMWRRFCKNSTGRRHHRGSSTNCLCSFTAVFHGLAPSYLAEGLLPVADVDSRQCLQLASMLALMVPMTHLALVTAPSM